jgi:hypothetical protein
MLGMVAETAGNGSQENGPRRASASGAGEKPIIIMKFYILFSELSVWAPQQPK